MKYIKQILEAINRGIQLALDDYEDGQLEPIAPKKEIIKNKNATKELIDSYNEIYKNFVDLDLPSGTLWAKCNIGSKKPEKSGNYYRWGEIVPKRLCDKLSYKFGTKDKMLKYNNDDRLKHLLPEDDVAFIDSPKEFKMMIPSVEQVLELIRYTDHYWTSVNGINGYKFVNNDDPMQFIFIPASGYKLEGDICNTNEIGCFWLSSVDESDVNCAMSMEFDDEKNIEINGNYRYNGFPIRPVLKK